MLLAWNVARNLSQSVLILVRLQKMTLQCHLLLLRGIFSCKDTISSQPYMLKLSSHIAELVHDIA
jgi:hypothetical protein